MERAPVPGLIIAGANPWTIALAEQMHELKTPVMLVDSSWQRLKPARTAGIPTYHGEILHEATEHNLDMAPYQVLIAATDNEAYNTLVCSEFAPEIGTDKVYQLGEGGSGEEGDYRKLPSSLQGRALFASGFGMADVQKRQLEGWIFRKTKLSEQFKFDDALEALPEAANMLLLLRPDGKMRFFTHASAPEPQPGDTIISYSPPGKKARAAKHSERREAEGRTAEPKPA